MKTNLIRICTIVFTLMSLIVQSQVIINEISYNPPESSNDSLEFIELYNAGDIPVNIGGWHFTAGIEDTLPSVDLQPGAYFVTAINAGAMQHIYSISVHQWTDGALNNGGELLNLVDAGGNFVDSVRYDDADPWPVEPDGDGPSLELKSPDLDNTDGANWQSSGGATGVIIEGQEVRGTPGAQNSGGDTPGPDLFIDLANFAFVPAIAVIPIGALVRWVNNEGQAHNVNGQISTFPDNPESFFSGAPAAGPWEYEFTFTIPGTYQYRCDPHAGLGMTGTIYVYDPLTYNDFSLEVLRQTNVNGSALFDGVPTQIMGTVHGINFQPEGYSFYIINESNVGINVFSFTPGSYTVTEGDQLLVSGVIDQFSGLLEIIPDDIAVLSAGNPLVSPFLTNEVLESDEGSHMEAFPFAIDSIVETGTSGYNIYTTHEDGNPLVIRLDADLGIDVGQIQNANAVRGIGAQFDNQLPFTSGYQILALEFLIVDAVPRLDADAITLAPNPASHAIQLAGDYLLQQVEIYSMDGRLLTRQEPNATNYPLDVSQLPPGVHQIKVNTPDGTWTSLVSIIR